MIDNRLEDKYRQIDRQMEKWLRYRKLSNYCGYLAFGIYFASLLYAFLLSSNNMVFFEQSVIPFTGFACALIILAASTFIKRKARTYRPEADDLMLHAAVSILKNLEDFNKTKASGLKREFRKAAIKSGKKILSTVRISWKLGDFRLAKKLFEDNISDILDSLRCRLVPILEKGHEETLKKAEQTVYQFAQYLLDPSQEGLQHTSKSMSELPNLGSGELGLFPRWQSFFATHTMLKHSTVVGLIFSISFIPAFFGVQRGLISTDSGFLFFAAIFGPSIAVYLSYVLKKTPD